MVTHEQVKSFSLAKLQAVEDLAIENKLVTCEKLAGYSVEIYPGLYWLGPDKWHWYGETYCNSMYPHIVVSNNFTDFALPHELHHVEQRCIYDATKNTKDPWHADWTAETFEVIEQTKKEYNEQP